ncbi:MAG: hypothetical protein ACRERC_20195 [Candidatus Binatia bacterium]
MNRRTMLATSAAAFLFASGGMLWATHTLAKTKGGCTDAQICCRYVKDGGTELDCMDAKDCAGNAGKVIPDKSKCAA